MNHRNLVVLSILTLLLGTRLYAQTGMGDIAGTVTDPSGAPVPSTKITVINEDTRATRTATTDGTGAYRVNGLLPATYTVRAEASGFQSYEQRGVALGPAVVKPVNVQLKIGAVTQTVEVTGKVPVISTESATVSYTNPELMTTEKPAVYDLVQNGFDEEQLLWEPGSSAGESVYNYGGTRGGFDQTNIEGIQRGDTSIHTNVDAIKEDHLVEMAPAEYARPTTVEATVKSGSNRVNGAVLAYYINPCLNATDTPFSRAQHGPCLSGWRTFYDVGGPVYIPKLYDGRNKTFFFFGLKKSPLQTVVSPNVVTVSVPTVAMQNGDFSNYPKTIMDPTTGQPFPGNIIPANRINSVSQTIVNQVYKPYYTYQGGPNNYTANGLSPELWKYSQTPYDLRIDQNAGSKDIIAVVYQKTREDTTFWASAHGQNLFANNLGNHTFSYGHLISLGETHTFSPTIVNELRLGYSRAYTGNDWLEPNLTTPLNGNTVLQQWGLQGITGPSGITGIPEVNIAGWQSAPGSAGFTYDNRYVGYDNITFVKGRHTFKAGFSSTWFRSDSPDSGPFFGYFNFTGLFTNEPWADFLLGLPGTFQRFTARPIVSSRAGEDGAFIQDDFRMTSKLTLSYGFRWDMFTAPYDGNGLYYNYDPSTQSIIVPNQHALQNVSPAWPVSRFPVELANRAGYPSKLVYGSSSWQPRFGFAYRLGKQTVLRGGYGVYSGALRFNALQAGGPFALTETYINSVVPTNPTGAQYAWPDPFPSSVAVANVLSATGVAQHYRDPYTQNWQISLERQLAPNWGLRATYMGVAGAQLVWNQNLNQEVASTQPYSASRLPDPGLQSIGFVQNGANSIYESFMVELEHHWAGGFYTDMAYTRAHNRTDSYEGILTFDQTAYGPEYSYDRNRDWGNDVQDVPNDFVLNTVYELPVGRGKRFASNPNRLLNGVIGNWTTTWVFTMHSGWWFTPTWSGTDIGNIGNTSGRRPDVVPGCDINAGAHMTTNGRWYNPACFTLPANGQLGDVGINSLSGPANWTIILNPYKEFPLKFREGAKLRIGAQIWNLTNTPPYALPNGTVNSSTAGAITGTTNVRGYASSLGGNRKIWLDVRVVF